MSATALALILVAAVAHATWNLFSKQASVTGASSFVWLMSLIATALYAPVVLIAVLIDPPRLTGLCWVFMIGTGLLQAGYFLFLQSGYRLGDLSLVYPVGRGSGALLAALAGIVLLGEHPGAAGLAGIGLVIAGVLLLGAPAATGRSAASSAARSADRGPGAPGVVPRASRAGGRPPGPAQAPRALAFALVTGMFIASYTLWDKYAVSTLRVPPWSRGTRRCR